jgi:dipeptidyl aminopeptidase/acylaminoacyl peptidase
MSRDHLAERLHDAAPPDAEGAELRAWAVLQAALDAEPPAPGRPRRRSPLPVLAALLIALSAGAAATAAPPGDRVAAWVQRVVAGPSAPAPRPSLGPLPGGGRLLVAAAGRSWVVEADGTRRRLPAAAGATWSPRGRYLAAWRGERLRAVTPTGRVAWTLTALGPLRVARWSPDGFRIAYLRDDALAVVAGDGTGARLLGRPVRPTAPAWRPGGGHVLAWVEGGGRVRVADADSGRVLWRSPGSVGNVRALQWSADGRRLLARRRSDVLRVLEPGRDRVWSTRVPEGRRVVAAAWAPAGRRLALVTHDPGGLSTVSIARDARRPLVGRRVFATTGRLDGVTWSPDGRRLLVAWRQADQWLFVPTTGRGRLVAVGDLRRRFGGTPSVAGWCCLRTPS